MPFRASFGTISGKGNDRWTVPMPVSFHSFEKPLVWEMRTQSDPRTLAPAEIPSLLTEGNAWTKNGAFPSALTEGVEHWGSWSGGDANTGTLTLTIEVEKEHASLRIAWLTGPNTGGLSITVCDTHTGQTLASLKEIPTGINHWLHWDIPTSVLENAELIHIDFADHGTDWGSWLAVQIPVWVQPMISDFR